MRVSAQDFLPTRLSPCGWIRAAATRACHSASDVRPGSAMRAAMAGSAARFTAALVRATRSAGRPRGPQVPVQPTCTMSAEPALTSAGESGSTRGRVAEVTQQARRRPSRTSDMAGPSSAASRVRRARPCRRPGSRGWGPCGRSGGNPRAGRRGCCAERGQHGQHLVAVEQAGAVRRAARHRFCAHHAIGAGAFSMARDWARPSAAR